MTTQLTNTENNKLIAEFMGFKIKDYEVLIPYKFTNMQVYLLPTSHGYYEADISDLCFNRDWNWLMPVVEKVEKLDFSVFIGKNSCCIAPYYLKEIPDLKNVVEVDKISAVYKSIVCFIKWYNQNK